MDPRATPPKRIRTSKRNKKNVIRWSRARKFDSNEPCIVITIDIIYVLIRAIQKKKKMKGKTNLRGGRFTSSDGVAWGSSVERDDRVFLFFVFLIFGLFLLYHTSRTGGR